MNKAAIYSHINLLRLRINEILFNYPFKELICNEIINASIIAIGEVDNSGFDDRETAKKMVRMQIENFFKPKNISLVVDKYWNERLIYGFTRINPTKDNLIRFRSVVDITKPSVLEIKYTMLNAVQNADLSRVQLDIDLNRQSNKIPKWIIASVIVGFVAIFMVLFLFATNSRYIKTGDCVVFDKWKSEYIEY
jgi:hypothetical protein